MEKNLISIIIPVYNAEKYLSECIDSLINQSYQNLEIIFINDGSTDDSVKILKKYTEKDKRIKVISQDNQGVSATRNRGLEEASGDYIMFVDSDDWIDQKTCEKAINISCACNSDVTIWSYIREYPKTSKVTRIFGDEPLEWDDNNIHDLYRRMVGLIREELSEPQKIDSLVTVWGKLYKRSIIGDVRFVDTELIGNEDALFNIFVFYRIKKAKYIPDVFYHYRKEITSFTHLYKAQLADKWKVLYDMILIHLQENKGMDECYEALVNRICLGVIGIGLNLAEDDTLTFYYKVNELNRILKMSHYAEALNKLQLKYLPIHWRVFFVLAQYKCSFMLYLLLMVMNYMRNK